MLKMIKGGNVDDTNQLNTSWSEQSLFGELQNGAEGKKIL